MAVGKYIEAVEIIRRLEGGITRPFLCRANNDRHYVVKGLELPPTERIAELLCARLAAQFGLPIPEHGCIYVDPALLRSMWLPLMSGSVAALIYSAGLMLPRPTKGTDETLPAGGAFNLKLAVIIALTMTAITLVSSVMLSQFGQVGVMLTATFSGFADAHASTASIAGLAKAGLLPVEAIVAPALIAISSNSLSKCVVAWVSGGNGLPTLSSRVDGVLWSRIVRFRLSCPST